MRMKATLITLVLAATAVLAPAAAATARTIAPAPPPGTTKQISPKDVEAAGGPVFNYRRLVLEFPAEVGSEACKSRDIYLAAGWYYWRHEDRYPYVDWDMWLDARRIFLAAGWYHWKDCIVGFERAGGDDHGYRHDTYLRQKSTGGYTHLDQVHLSNPHDRPALVYTQFGSSLRQL